MTKITRPLPKFENFQPCELSKDVRCNPSSSSIYCVDCMLRDFKFSVIDYAKNVQEGLDKYCDFFNLLTPAKSYLCLLLSELYNIEEFLFTNFNTTVREEVDNGN